MTIYSPSSQSTVGGVRGLSTGCQDSRRTIRNRRRSTVRLLTTAVCPYCLTTVHPCSQFFTTVESGRRVDRPTSRVKFTFTVKMSSSHNTYLKKRQDDGGSVVAPEERLGVQIVVRTLGPSSAVCPIRYLLSRNNSPTRLTWRPLRK